MKDLPYLVSLDAAAEKSLLRLDKPTREQIIKKLQQLERDDLASRHLRHGIPIFVEEVGQYRIGFFVEPHVKPKPLGLGCRSVHENLFDRVAQAIQNTDEKKLATYDAFVLKQHRVDWSALKKDLVRLIKTKIR